MRDPKTSGYRNPGERTQETEARTERKKTKDKEPEERQARDMMCETWLLSEAGRQPGDPAGSQEGLEQMERRGDWDGEERTARRPGRRRVEEMGTQQPSPSWNLRKWGRALRKWGDWGNG